MLLGNQHPVEPGEPIGIDLAFQIAADLLLGLAAQLQRDDLACPFADAVGDIVSRNVEPLAVLGNAAHQNMGVRMPGVVMIDRNPVEPCAEICFHLRH